MAEFEKHAARTRAPFGHQHRREQLVRPTQRLAIAEYEVSQGNAPLAHAGRQLHLRTQRHQGWNAVRRRRGVAQVAGHRTGVLDLLATDFTRCGFEGIELRRQRCGAQFAPGHGGADAVEIALVTNAAQIRHARDVEDVRIDRLADARWIKIGATSQNRQALISQRGKRVAKPVWPQIARVCNGKGGIGVMHRARMVEP